MWKANLCTGFPSANCRFNFRNNSQLIFLLNPTYEVMYEQLKINITFSRSYDAISIVINK